MRKIFSNPLIYVAVLAGAVFICFGRTLGSYFLADDFGEVAYVAKIFDGDWPRLWSNFTGNYMQVPSMAVYRPWLLMTLFFDFAVWKTNAAGYYLTNLLHYLACTILIFTLIRLLTSYWGKLRSTLAATFSGLLFATHPLHCESVSWVVGRVDIVCLTYYLLGLVSVALYVRNLNKKWLILTFASFWVSILTKEMAIALPVTATALAFLWGNTLKDGRTGELSKEKTATGKSGNDLNFDPSPSSPAQANPPVFSTEPSRASAIAALQKLDQELQPHATPASVSEGEPATIANKVTAPDAPGVIDAPMQLRQRIAVAVPVAAMLFVCTIVYFIIRYACLGTITGGYTGSIGSSQFSGILQKWTDIDTVLRIVFPLNQFVFADGTAQKNLLSAIYLMLIALVTARLIIGSLPRRWLLFLFISSITALVPIYQLWGIGYELEGSRFVFFLTVSLSMLFPIILFSPLEKIPTLVEQSGVPATTPTAENPFQPKPARQASNRLLVLSIVALSALTLVFGKLTLRNNIPWIHAGKQTESIHDKAATLSKSTPSGKQVAVVGIPKDEGGAHMILNGTTFRTLIIPPFAEPGLTGKILTFEPSLFGDADKIDTAHFKETLLKPDVASFLVWDMDKKDFVSFNPGTPAAIPQPISISLLSPASSLPLGATPTGPVASYPYTQGRGDLGPNGLIENAETGLGIRISGLHLRPAQFDYVVVRAHSPASPGDSTAEGKNIFRNDTCKVQLESSRNEKTSLNVRFDQKVTQIAGNYSVLEIRLPVSAYWRYFCAGEITAMVIDFPPAERTPANGSNGPNGGSRSLAIDSVDLLPAALIAPEVTVLDRTSADDGSFTIDRRKSADTAPVRIAVDTAKLKDAASVEMQILHKNFFFDNLKSEAALISGTETVLHATGTKTTFVIPDSIVKSSGYVQLRLKCLNSHNQQIGDYSFPITLRVVANQL